MAEVHDEVGAKMWLEQDRSGFCLWATFVLNVAISYPYILPSFNYGHDFIFFIP